MRCYWKGVALGLDIRQDLWLSGGRAEMGWNRGGGLRQCPSTILFVHCQQDLQGSTSFPLLGLLLYVCPFLRPRHGELPNNRNSVDKSGTWHHGGLKPRGIPIFVSKTPLFPSTLSFCVCTELEPGRPLPPLPRRTPLKSSPRWPSSSPSQSCPRPPSWPSIPSQQASTPKHSQINSQPYTPPPTSWPRHSPPPPRDAATQTQTS